MYKYAYNGQDYPSAYDVRQAIWKKEHKVFGAEPTEGKVEFWKALNVELTQIASPESTGNDAALREIRLLKYKLAETDYAVIKIAEGAATVEEYADVIAQRKEWRARINELEAGDA